MLVGKALVGKLSWFNEKVNVVLDTNGDFFHERAVWVTFAESKVTENALRRVRNLLRLVVVFPG